MKEITDAARVGRQGHASGVARFRVPLPAAGRGRRRAGPGAILTALWALGALGALGAVEGCGAGARERRAPVYWDHSPPRCDVDEVREYYCDNLVQMGSVYETPAPYEECPVSLETHVGAFEPPPPVSVFDPSYTRYSRQRLPPGNQCCYSWCSPLAVSAPNPLTEAMACRTPAAFRESYCIDEPESGTSIPSSAPFQKCPVGIAPPSTGTFSAPKSALLSERLTADRRREGALQCCYSWCSQAPPTSGLEGG